MLPSRRAVGLGDTGIMVEPVAAPLTIMMDAVLGQMVPLGTGERAERRQGGAQMVLGGCEIESGGAGSAVHGQWDGRIQTGHTEAHGRIVTGAPSS